MKRAIFTLLILLVFTMVFAGCSNEDVKMPETIEVTEEGFNVTSAQLINAVEKELTELHGSKVKFEEEDSEPADDGEERKVYFFEFDNFSRLYINCDPQTDYIRSVTGMFYAKSQEDDFDDFWPYISIFSNALNPDEDTANISSILSEGVAGPPYTSTVSSHNNMIVYICNNSPMAIGGAYDSLYYFLIIAKTE